MNDLNSIFEFSQACRDKGSLFLDSNINKMLSPTYQNVLVLTLRENNLIVVNITYHAKDQYCIHLKNYGSIIINNQKQNNAYKVQQFILKKLGKLSV